MKLCNGTALGGRGSTKYCVALNRSTGALFFWGQLSTFVGVVRQPNRAQWTDIGILHERPQAWCLSCYVYGATYKQLRIR